MCRIPRGSQQTVAALATRGQPTSPPAGLVRAPRPQPWAMRDEKHQKQCRHSAPSPTHAYDARQRQQRGARHGRCSPQVHRARTKTNRPMARRGVVLCDDWRHATRKVGMHALHSACARLRATNREEPGVLAGERVTYIVDCTAGREEGNWYPAYGYDRRCGRRSPTCQRPKP